VHIAGLGTTAYRLPMSITIEYSSRRREIWRTYWRLWRQRLWKTHATIVTAIAFGICLGFYRGLPPTFLAAVAVLAIAIAPVLVFPLIPLLRFKPERRILTIDERGIDTAIGSRSGTIAWSDIGSIHEEAGNLVMRRNNGNAFVVPPRAFSGEQERTAFMRFARTAREAVTGDAPLSSAQRPELPPEK
jgi:hypothetical protein